MSYTPPGNSGESRAPDGYPAAQVRVAKILGERRPMDQIADFLGGEVVEALWRLDQAPPVDEVQRV